MGTSDKVLQDNIVKVISKLENQPDGAEVCKAHSALAEGVKVLLQIQQAILDGKVSEGNSIKIGNVSITGSLAVCVAGVVYAILKLHQII